MVDNVLPKVLSLCSDSELRILLLKTKKKGLVCKLLERLTLFTQRRCLVNNVLLFLPLKVDNNPPRFLGKEVLMTFGISLPVMIGSLKSSVRSRFFSIDELSHKLI